MSHYRCKQWWVVSIIIIFSAFFLPWVTQTSKNIKLMDKKAFNSKWEKAYFCEEQDPQCLICLQAAGVSKE
jgi:hypothetical protein